MKRVIGSCNGCGACCKVLALPFAGVTLIDGRHGQRTLTVLRSGPASPDFRHYLHVHGVGIHPVHFSVPVDANDPDPVRFGTYGQTPVVYVRSRCAQLNDDNTCRLHGTPEMPETCRRYPTIHDDLTVVKPECSYEVVDD